jgi:hypothetical protein
MEKTIDASVETTKFVNIDDKPFDIYTNGKLVFHLEPNEEKVMVFYVAQVGAKHLVDRVLQEKHKIKDTLTDTPLRKSLFAQILPDVAQERDIKPLSKEEEKVEIEKLLKKQEEVLASLNARKEKEDERDKEIAILKEELAKLKEVKVAKKSK